MYIDIGDRSGFFLNVDVGAINFPKSSYYYLNEKNKGTNNHIAFPERVLTAQCCSFLFGGWCVWRL
jgi:hypothetical protein